MLIDDDDGLRAAEVYAEADALGGGRSAAELGELERRLREATSSGASPLDYGDLLVNDLEQAAISLRPEIAEALAALDEAGADAHPGQRLRPDRRRAVRRSGRGRRRGGGAAAPLRARDRFGAAAARIIPRCSSRERSATAVG